MRQVVFVTGLSGAGKASALRALEDLGFQAVDNPPLNLVETLVRRESGPVAIGLDARTRGFDTGQVLQTYQRLRADPGMVVHLLYLTAEPAVLLRRYSETRRRHPMAPDGRVIDGIEREIALLRPLLGGVDWTIDTSELPPHGLRQLIECRLLGGGPEIRRSPVSITVMSFAFPAGLPRDADMVFDARFLRNPHYDPILRPRTGLDPEVAAYIESDPDFERFFTTVAGLITMVLPRFVQEGKKYVTIAVGCTGGRHRSVRIVERLASVLGQHGDAGREAGPWQVTAIHRELVNGQRPHSLPAGKV